MLFDAIVLGDDPLGDDLPLGALWLVPESIAATQLDADGEWREPVRGDGARWAEPSKARWPCAVGRGVLRKILAKQAHKISYLVLTNGFGWEALAGAIPDGWSFEQARELYGRVRVPRGVFSPGCARDAFDALAVREWPEEVEDRDRES